MGFGGINFGFTSSSSTSSSAITGTGTANTVAKFTGAQTIGNSTITDDGTTIALGTTSVVNIGSATASGRRLDIKQNTATWSIGSWTLATSYGALYVNVTPGNTNYVLEANGGVETGLNVADSSGAVRLQIAGNARFYQYNTYAYCTTLMGVNIAVAPSASLHVVGAGATSASYGLRVDSSTTTNTFTVRDDGKSAFGSTPTGQRLAIYQLDANGSNLDLVNNLSGGRTYTLNVSSTSGLFTAGCLITYDATAAAARLLLDSSGNYGLAQTTFGTSATNTFAIGSGTAPSTSPADCFQLYSKDITAGNAAPHFRTEAGNIIKLYTISTGWNPTNVTTDRVFDANATTLDEIADVLGTLILDLENSGLISA